MTSDELRYPIGRFEVPAERSMRDVARWIDDIEELPSAFTQVVTSLTDRQLDTPYRPGAGPFVKLCTTCPTATSTRMFGSCGL